MSRRTTHDEEITESAIVRRFNRMYTRFIGTLNEGLLDSDFSLAEARILYELASRTAPRASDIAAELGLDAGYLSRLLRQFEQRQLLRKEVSKDDGRSVILQLTARGKAAFRKLDASSEQQAKSILDSLGPASRMELLRSMRSIENI